MVLTSEAHDKFSWRCIEQSSTFVRGRIITRPRISYVVTHPNSYPEMDPDQSRVSKVLRQTIRDNNVYGYKLSNRSASNFLFQMTSIDENAISAQQRLNLKRLHATGPFNTLNPTNVQFHVRFKSGSEGSMASEADSGSDIALLWRARDNRKDRNSIVVPRTEYGTSKLQYSQQKTSSYREIGRNILRMVTTFPYWDMAFGVSFAYTTGSVTWVVNGCFAWLPVAFPETGFEKELLYGCGITAFLGVICFEIGAGLAFLEAVNDGCFHGSAMRRLLEGHDTCAKKMFDAKIQHFFQHGLSLASSLSRRDDVERGLMSKGTSPGKPIRTRRGGMDLGSVDGESSEYMTFRWWPTWQSLRSHHIHEVGFLACSLQFSGATIFILPGTVSPPGIANHLSQAERHGLYWIPQILASLLFIIAGILFMLETQDRWYRPAPNVLGWWIGLFSAIGSLGFA